MTYSKNLPLWLAFGSALFWGLWWMPVRALEAVGLTGAWAGTAMFAGAIPALILLFLWSKRPITFDLRVILSGAMVGSAMMLYSYAVTETTVVRAILLFYLAPAWALAIECVFLGRKFNGTNALALVLAACGILLIFRGDVSLANWTIGDGMALLSGVCWAVGSTLVFSGKDVGARTIALFGCSGALIVGLLMLLLSGAALPITENGVETAGLLTLSGTFYIAPVLIATLWSARRLNPTTISFLLTGEIISGVASSAVFLNEPFGWPEAIGSCVIIGAALVEVISPKKTS
ncbi:DMT family transporter [Amylibacter sp. IMCC11727]|uniref:DMT family transporter n=1 Tax=Amylibacter sp. IMCC11727 TaxID=3039851 RepID=UPI00244DCC84|nr:DMT family transporter [Amylibacter sp. IMCC11727]WGI21472.1 DMT family transporter [Amylibacter sp. IMCC11727]